MDNSINFKGAFWIKQPSETFQRKILRSLGENNLIIKNFTPEGDVLYITEKSADKNIAKILVKNKKAKFKYYKDLNPKSGFNINMPEEAMKILSNYQKKIVTAATELKSMFKIKKPEFNFSIRKKDNTLEKCMQTLNLDINEYNIVNYKGFSEIYTKDADKKLVAIISEPGQGGFRYARIQPQKPGDEVKRYAVLPGEKFTYINSPDSKVQDATADFLKNYIKSKKANEVTHNATHQ